ncbi:MULTISPECIES: phage tail protein [Photorhabdus]|uniref:phage tail protein n=1 Tax=Photorhabdus TaxID=29487 RepID=UPI000DCC68B6|nr:MULTISPECIES: phage tail protein [Photorhabdus]AXG44983.1 phage tail protein [Photorhabdus laumondii subsp. laumondii]NDL17711.1 phage tail protein [Photorhabdus laumondii subsp. laumondii]NDL49460.1 phage tail protein [Photorhabdus laumondii subsp. laumondii]NDL54054.1 phage tail protein [Photorhabdus laumondii subsp. laumondii]RAW82594.1 phage tail protein [Photorhabdus sp. S5P8-50]
MMAALGLFVFMLKTTPYQSLQHQQSWRYGFNNRVGARPAFQFMGPNNDTITLSGALYPEITGGRLSLLALQLMAQSGKAWSFLDGSGTIYGMFIIESIDQTKSEFFTDGTARKIDFTVTLRRVDDNLGEMFGDLSTQMTDLKTRVTHKLGGLFS